MPIVPAAAVALAMALAGALAPAPPTQERYPSRPIALVLPYAAGGGTDAIARVLAKAPEEKPRREASCRAGGSQLWDDDVLVANQGDSVNAIF